MRSSRATGAGGLSGMNAIWTTPPKADSFPIRAVPMGRTLRQSRAWYWQPQRENSRLSCRFNAVYQNLSHCLYFHCTTTYKTNHGVIRIHVLFTGDPPVFDRVGSGSTFGS